jgi:hypothetical protein
MLLEVQSVDPHKIRDSLLYCDVRGGSVNWGTALQDGSSRVRFQKGSLRFFIDLNLTEMNASDIF